MDRSVIDSLTRQRSGESTEVRKVKYTHAQPTPSLGARFVFECGAKLKAKGSTIAKAAFLFHKFIASTGETRYDIYLIGATCLSIACKLENEDVKLRDVINVSHHTLHNKADILDLSEQYWNLRDSFVQAELFVLRMLNFNTTTSNPHIYLLEYLRTLECWMPGVFNKVPVVHTSWALLQDFHHSPAIIQNEPQVVALAAIYMTLQIYGVQVPLTSDVDGRTWYEALHKNIQKDVIWSVVEQITAVYDEEKNWPLA